MNWDFVHSFTWTIVRLSMTLNVIYLTRLKGVAFSFFSHLIIRLQMITAELNVETTYDWNAKKYKIKLKYYTDQFNHIKFNLNIHFITRCCIYLVEQYLLEISWTFALVLLNKTKVLNKYNRSLLQWRQWFSCVSPLLFNCIAYEYVLYNDTILKLSTNSW